MGRWTPFVIAPTGTAEGSSSGQSAAKSVRETSPCRAETAFARAREPEGEHGHVEPGPRRVGVAAEREELLAGEAERPGIPAEGVVDEGVLVDVEAGRHGRVRREDRAGPDLAHGLVERRPGRDALAQQLEQGEGRVALVQVDRGVPEPEGREQTPAADPEHDLLPEPERAIARVEAARDRPERGRVAGVVRVEQVERHPADRGAPGADRAGRALQLDRDLERFAVRARDGRDRRGVTVEGVGRVLLAAGREALAEVPLAVEQPDPDEGDVEVRALLEVVAGEEAEPARVEGERVVEPELGREVRDRRPAAVGLLEPAVPAAEVLAEPVHHQVVPAAERGVGRGRREVRRGEAAEEPARVLAGVPPERGREFGKERPGLGVPGPPEVGRERAETRDAGGKGQ